MVVLYEGYFRKTIGKIGIGMLCFLLLFQLFSIAVVVSSELLSMSAVSEVAGNVIFRLFYAVGYFLCFALPAALLRLLFRNSPSEALPSSGSLRLSRSLFPILFAGIFLIYSAAAVNALIFSSLREGIFPSAGAAAAEDTELLQPYEWILEWIVVAVVPGICEELLFRGTILSGTLVFGRSNAILISAFLFSMMHQNFEQIFYTFVAGIVLGLVYVRTKNIWNCILLHLLNNSLSVLEELLDQRLPESVSGLVLPALETVLAIVGVCSVLYLVFRFFGRKKDFSEGFFGKTLPQSDGYAAYKIPAGRCCRLFLAPSMVIFLVLSVIQMFLRIAEEVLLQYVGTLG